MRRKRTLAEKAKRIFFRLVPYLLVMVAGFGLFFAAGRTSGDWKNLWISVAAGLVSIPLIFVLYELLKEKSHKKLNEYAYSHTENSLYEIADGAEDVLRELMQGVGAYFEEGCAVIDDSHMPALKLQMTEYGKAWASSELDLEYENPEYSESSYEEDMLHICDETEYKGGLRSFEKDDIVPYLSDAFYLGYQVYSIDLDPICEVLSDIKKNAFLLSHLEEDEIIKILRIVDGMRYLNAFIKGTEDLFCEVVGSSVTGLSVKEEDATSTAFGRTGAYSLWYQENGFRVELDRNMLVNADKAKLERLYMLNPEYLILFGDILTEAIWNIQDWMEH